MMQLTKKETAAVLAKIVENGGKMKRIQIVKLLEELGCKKSTIQGRIMMMRNCGLLVNGEGNGMQVLNMDLIAKIQEYVMSYTLPTQKSKMGGVPIQATITFQIGDVRTKKLPKNVILPMDTYAVEAWVYDNQKEVGKGEIDVTALILGREIVSIKKVEGHVL